MGTLYRMLRKNASRSPTKFQVEPGKISTLEIKEKRACQISGRAV
jgi:hypothetical protein